MSSSSSKVLAALALVITFAVGALVGAAGNHLLTMRRGGLMTHYPPAQMIVRHLDRRLHLNDRQRAQVTEIVQRHEQKIRGLWAGVRPAVRTEIDAANSEIDRVLTPEQRAEFAKMKMRLRH